MLKKRLYAEINSALEDQKTPEVRRRVFRVRLPRVDEFRSNYPEIEIRLQQIKKESLSNLRAYSSRAIAKMEENGFKVFRAGTAVDALNYIDGVINETTVVKSKSNAAKEVNLSKHLKNRGIEVVETDLGDRICQLGNVNPAHPLGPAIHLPVERVAEIFNAYSREKLNPDPDELVKWARESLRDTLLKAKISVTGANAIAADTGSIVLTENEGNIRMAVSVPPVLVVVAGVEKIVPTLENCLDVVRAAAGFGVGQEIGTYVSVVSGLADQENSIFRPRGPIQVHVVLLEFGRWDVLGTPLERTLQCINCGHCLRVCPVFCELGERYGKPFFGGIGVLKVAAGKDMDAAYLSGLDLCLGCRRCTSVCPTGMPTPDLIAYVRRQRVQKQGLAGVKKYLIKNLRQFSPLAKAIVYQSQWLYSGKYHRFRKTRIKIRGRGIIPGLARKTLTQMFQDNKTGDSGKKRVIYFPGCMHNLFFTEVGMATVDVLKKAGCEVILPPEQMCCGYPAIAVGDLAAAKEIAGKNLEFFRSMGFPDVLVDCPTCQTGLNYYQQLFEKDTAELQESSKKLAGGLKNVSDFLAGFLDKLGPLSMKGLSVAYHQPCHAKSRGSCADEQILKNIGQLDFKPSKETACCGFGGVFSIDFYNLSKVIRGRRVKDLIESGPEIIVTSCPGCLYHLSEGLYEQGSQTRVLHITELLSDAINSKKCGSEM